MKSIVNGNAPFGSCCIASNVWYYAVKSLEFVRQLCISRYREFGQSYCFSSTSFRDKIEFVVMSSIYHSSVIHTLSTVDENHRGTETILLYSLISIRLGF